MNDKQFRHLAAGSDDVSYVPTGVPGKVALTARLAPRPQYQVVFRVADPETARVFASALGARDSNGVAGDADAAVERAAGGSGQQLPDALRARFETSLGADLSSVRLHTGPESAAAADAVGARAYTIGNDIHFGEGHYQPLDPYGIHLIAHEVAHTVQQAGSGPRRQNKLDVSTPGDALEVEADRAADAMVSGRPAVIASAPAPVARVAREKWDRQERHDDMTAGPTTAQAATLQAAQAGAAQVLATKPPVHWKALRGPTGQLSGQLASVMGDDGASAAVKLKLENVLPAAENLRSTVDGRALPRDQMLAALQGKLQDGDHALGAVLKPQTIRGVTINDRETFHAKLEEARKHPNHTIPGTPFTIPTPQDENQLIREYEPPSAAERTGLQEIRAMVTKTAELLDLKHANPDLNLIRAETDNALSALRSWMDRTTVGSTYRAHLVAAESALSQALSTIAGAIGTEQNVVAQVHRLAGEVSSGISAVLAMPRRRDAKNPNDPTAPEPKAGYPRPGPADEHGNREATPDPWARPTGPVTPIQRKIARDPLPIIDPWPEESKRPGPGYTPPGVVDPWPEPTHWNSAYGPNAEQNAHDQKDKTGPTRAASEMEARRPNGSVAKGTPVGQVQLTAADLLAIFKAARVTSMLGPTGSDQRKQHEDQVGQYVDYINDAFRIMRIDTIEAQALFIAHAVGETGLSRLTEGQINAFEDNPAKVRVDTSLMTDKKDPTGKDGQVLGPRRYSRGRHAESGTIDPLHVIPDEGGMDENQFDKTFIGRGAIQVTHQHNYMRVLMVLEKRADELQEEIDADPDAADANAKAHDVAKLREAVAAIAEDPSMAAKPEYSFLFSMGHMQASPMASRSGALGATADFSGKGPASMGMTGNRKDPRATFKADAYAAAHRILTEKAKAAAADAAPASAQ